jgi:small subunit ribosomal protein S8
MSLQSTDPVADMLTRIRNAVLANKNVVSMPASKLKITIATELKKAGYLTDVKVEKGTPRDTLIITIFEEGSNSVITEIERVSKPGRRVYAAASDIPKVKSGRGIILVSTSKGVMTGQQAVKNRLGGELLCKVY